MSIPLMNLKRQHERLAAEIHAAVNEVMEAGNFILGKQTQQFEEEFARFCGAKHCVGVGNGTDALVLAFRALEIGQGDVFITTPNTFTASAEAGCLVGARPVFVDIDPDTYLIDMAKLEQTLIELQKKKTPAKAVVAVHLYGQMCNMTTLCALSKKFGFRIVEDAAQAHGATWEGKAPGVLGDVASYSFYPGKNLGAFGDAGGLVTNDSALAGRLEALRNHGRQPGVKYEHDEIGYNSRLDTIQAAVLRVKLRHLSEWNSIRNERAAAYAKLLEGVSGLRLPRVQPAATSVFYVYTVAVTDRSGLMEALKKADIASGIYYPTPLHLQKAFAFMGHKEGDFPVTEKAAKEILSLPMDAELLPEELTEVANVVREFCERRAAK